MKNVNEFTKYLVSLDTGVDPTVHVNGPNHPTAVVVVDFGTPLKPIKLTAEQAQEVATRMRRLTKELFENHDLVIRVNNDYSTGIFWSSV